MTRLDAVDQLNEVHNVLWTIWMALGNSADMDEDNLVNVRESLGQSAVRMEQALDALQGREP